ncbi:hypothetical protein BaRGS_00038633 [Batillaria attramentaria]|uniref:Uncharacterized protein n=1 Tax=Batillaria attramentaria TaxID=370345 RepID=A0ABD0J5I3_9CAEN
MDSPQQICTTIVQAVVCMHSGPHAILLVIRLDDFNKQKEFGCYRRHITNFLTVLFTGGDDLEREKSDIRRNHEDRTERTDRNSSGMWQPANRLQQLCPRPCSSDDVDNRAFVYWTQYVIPLLICHFDIVDTRYPHTDLSSEENVTRHLFSENDGIQSTTEDTNTQEYRFGKIPTQFEDGVPAERTTYIIVGANVVGFAVLAAFVITLNLIYIRRGRRSNRMSVEMHQISELNAPHRPGTLYSEGSNFYEEIADGVLPLNLGARPSAPVCQRTEPESGVIPVRIPTAPSAHVIAVSTDSGPSTTGDYMDMGQGVISVPREDNLQLLDHDSDEYMDMSEGIKSDNRTEQLSRLYENIPH